MRVAVSGSSGLVGSALVESLVRDGHEVARLVRSGRPVGTGDIHWDPSQGSLDSPALESCDAVVHLAGESIASGRWTRQRRLEILESRVKGTRLLAKALSKMERPPQVFLSASAVGFYGNREDEELTEKSPAGQGFLADVCRAWEEAACVEEGRGMRLVQARFGVVLSTDGGALARMLPPFRLGLGGRLGTGRQWMSWITLTDAVAVIRHALLEASLRGPVNVVAPGAVTNADFTRALATALGRPAVFPVPAFALRLLLGDMAEELLLASQRVVPAALTQSGYRFAHPRIDEALRAVLG